MPRAFLARRLSATLALLLCLAATTWAGASTASAMELTASLTPVPSVSGQTVQWSAVGGEVSYVVAVSNLPRGTAGRTTQYLTLLRKAIEPQTYTPTLQPEQTVYVGVSADKGATWSTEEAAVSSKPSTPVLSVSGETVQWKAISGETSYVAAVSNLPRGTAGRTTQYLTVSRKATEPQTYTPTLQPEQTVYVGVSADKGATWSSQEATVTAPSAPTEEPAPEKPAPEEPAPGPSPEESPLPAGRIIGTNDGAGWGETAARTILSGHITWNRVEIGTKTNTLPTSLLDGFEVLAIVGNVGDATPLSQVEPAQWGREVVSQIQTNPGMAIAEAGNEMYYKGGVANPVRYGKLYLAAVNAMKAAGIHVPLLFNMWGDYPLGSWASPSGWSQDASGGGWLHDAVANVPGLAAAILANGMSAHPYGALGENKADEQGVAAVAAQEAVAMRVLGSIPPFYVTEFGYALDKCGSPDGACSQSEQASKLHSAYEAFLADPHVKGIWWYQSHDDGTGAWGYMNDDGTTRPSFTVLSSLAKAQGQ
jgi:hypothetical protein